MLFGLAKGVAKLGFGGGFRRMGTGLLAGGLYGGLSSDNQSANGVFGDIARGAALGLGIGTMTTGFGLRSAAKLGFGGARMGVKGAMFGTVAAGKASLNVAQFALNNPRTAMGIGLAGAGMYGLATSGPNSTSISSAETAQLAEQGKFSSTGFSPGMGSSRNQESRAAFLNSTIGLTQGLHRGRH